MKLTYWCSRHFEDSPVYNVRCQIRKACKAEADQLNDEFGREVYSPPFKVTVEYSNAFDLVTQCIHDEGAGLFEWAAFHALWPDGWTDSEGVTHHWD